MQFQLWEGKKLDAQQEESVFRKMNHRTICLGAWNFAE